MEIEISQGSHNDVSHQIYTAINVQGMPVRVNMRQYEQKHGLVLFTWGLSTILGVTIPLALIQMKLELGLFPFFIGTAVGFIPLNVLVLFYHNCYSKIFIFWALLTNTILFTLGVLFACQLPCAGVTTLAYCGIELIGTLVLSSNKTLATIKLLVYFQLVIVGFKLDGMVGVDWSQVLTGFGILLAFIIMVALALVIYSMIGGLACLNSPFFAIRRRGAIFTYLNLLSVCCLIGSILWNVYINDNCGHILIAGALFSWISIIFTFPNIAEITLCFCKIQSIRQKVIPKLEKLQYSEIKTLYRASSNWLVPHLKINIFNQNLLSEECISCMVKQANATWMSCGHCVFCFDCAQSIVKINPRCALCKQQPTHILKINAQAKELKLKPSSTNEVTVLESYELKQ